MKIAVIFSGLVRGDYEQNIKDHKIAFPNADFFYTSWKPSNKYEEKEWSRNGKISFDYNFIHKYYPSMKMTYNPGVSWIRPYLRLYRKMLDTDWDRQYLPGHLKEKSVDDIKKLMNHIISHARKMTKHQIKQHLIYAMTVRDFIDQDKYDILIRTRYDTVLADDFHEHVSSFINLVMETGRPVGFNHFNEDGIQGAISPKREVKLKKGFSLHDFLIIHKANKFDPRYVFELYEQKKLDISESGWFQILCAPYVEKDDYGFSIEAKGFARLQTQYHNEKKHFYAYRNITPDDFKALNAYKQLQIEEMQVIHTNVDRNIGK